MKLKYKLAREWCIEKEMSIRRVSNAYISPEAYLAGFEAARDMAIALYLEEDMHELKPKYAVEKLRRVGEEEVGTYNIESPWEKMR